MHHRFGEVGVEGLLEQVHALQAELAHHVEQEVEQRLDLRWVLPEGGFTGIEHRQQSLGHPSRGALHLVRLLVGHPLAVVVEVGLQAQGDVLERVALDQQGLDVVLDRLAGLSGRGTEQVVFEAPHAADLAGEVGEQLRLVEGGKVVAHRHFSSSTISASMMSSSPSFEPAWPEVDAPIEASWAALS